MISGDLRAGRRLIDVEDALRWAFRDELPKRGAVAATGVSPMVSLIALGTVVDTGSREPGFPAALGEPHPDATAIEAAVLALGRFSGCSIDGIDLAPDFGLQADQRRALRHAVASMVGHVVGHARLGRRPVCHAPDFACGPAIGANGKPRVLVTVVARHDGAFGQAEEAYDEPARATRAGHYTYGAFCPLAWDPSPQDVVDERADYLAWWVGLDQLARDLADLATLAVLPPSAPLRPWLGDRDRGKPPMLFRPADPVYRPQRRAAVEAERDQRGRRKVAPVAAARAARSAPPRGGRKAG